MNNSVATLDYVPADRRARVERQPERRPLVVASDESPRRWLVVDHAGGVHPVFAWAQWTTALADARLCVLERACGTEDAA